MKEYLLAIIIEAIQFHIKLFNFVENYKHSMFL